MPLSDATRELAGILLLTIVGIESGGELMLRITTGRQQATAFQRTFFRAGHAHAGVLVILSLTATLYADGAGLTGAPDVLARSGVPLAAILIPAGFFFSAIGREPTRPNRLVWLILAGAISLTAGVVALGIGLLTS